VLEEEATWLGARLAGVPDDAFPLLNVGSSTAHFREVTQPWIHRELFAPLAARGVEVVHADLKQEPGVDVAEDFLSADGRGRLAQVGAPSILCSNMLEHVADRPRAIEAIKELWRPGGYLLVSCPSAFPYHPDPIDTLYRPSVSDLIRAFEADDVEVVDSAEVTGRRAAYYLSDFGTRRLRFAARMLVPFVRPRAWLENVRWAPRPVRATCVLFRKHP
jgi:SAM-dependent methyltransferase